MMNCSTFVFLTKPWRRRLEQRKGVPFQTRQFAKKNTRKVLLALCDLQSFLLNATHTLLEYGHIEKVCISICCIYI